MRLFTLALICIHLLWCINSQWLDIWYDDGSTQSEWTKSDYAYFDYDGSDYDNACVTNKCICLWGGEGTDQWIYRATDISTYDSLRLKYDLTAYSFEASDACQISYAYDTKTAKALCESIEPTNPTSSTAHHYTDRYCSFPSAVGKNTIWIWLEIFDGTRADNKDLCFWDNIYLQGTLPQPTPSPTSATLAPSTLDPTLSPTNNPTLLPTKNPTKSQTKSPTKSPIKSPTKSPTNNPNVSPSEVPSASPTKRPSETQETQAPSVNIATAADEGDDDNDDNDDDGANDVKEESGSANGLPQDYMPLIIGVAGIVSGCFCFCLCFVLKKTKQKKGAQIVGDKSHGHMEKVKSVEFEEEKENEPVPQKKVIINAPGGSKGNNDEKKDVALFFSKELQLPQYYQSFIDNGFDSMRAMMAIKEASELQEIGVNLPGHQSLILSIIKKKKEETDGQMTTDAMTTEPEAEKAEKDYEKEELDAQMTRDRQMVKAWFDFNVGLAKCKYHELFIENGYESMKAMQAIRSKAELEEIGVTKVGHRALIFSEIERLRNMDLNAQYGGAYNAHQMQQYGGHGMQQQYGMQINYEGGGGNGPGGEW